MEFPILEAKKRASRGKGPARRLRASGRIPAICYGRGVDPMAIHVDPKALAGVLSTERGRNAIIRLTVEGEAQRTVMLREEQHRPLTTGVPLHLDFYEVAMDREMVVEVPIVLTGVAEGVKTGGMVQQILSRIAVRCLPDRIPTRIEYDITPMAIGDAAHLSDLVLPEGVKPAMDLELTFASCLAPTQEKEAAPAEAEAVAAEGEAEAEGKEKAEKDKDKEKKERPEKGKEKEAE